MTELQRHLAAKGTASEKPGYRPTIDGGFEIRF
jgi:hypothetical protein